MSSPDPTDDVLVRVRDLRFGYETRPIYDGVDIDIRRGRVTAIMGPSGTGKTTLLRIIGGQWRPKSGSVLFDGRDVHKQSRKQLYDMRKRMGMLFQHGALLTDLTVFDNVAFPLREHSRLPEPLIRDIVLMKLEAVGLRGAAQLYPEQLSGGMARRVALARAIAFDPDMVMYDEPFTGQDPISMGVLMRLIRSLNQSLGITSVVVSHDVEEVLSISDYAYIVHGGKVLDHGTPDAIRASESPLVRQFLEGRHDGPIAFHYKGPTLQQDLLGGTP
ncbi:MAG: ABC transporter ATP-binding protein [Sinimarinibacterium flocculans]|uniref:Phospholipid/cholesterol/gamma-HCH transport system ATP-binding protein n=1 Tax=Sinimarinibacterium flocculans TaxID=985250 RepID=A0A318EFA2_9GAMM|nr:ATP-binding cassette domain-containing protein [Sinimarinibacterium flocculans]PXV70344.1 phospholipid/cholesterol/gamma-HCH transport system ATP-binding protein [Sinimarinibacterium flocculans]